MNFLAENMELRLVAGKQSFFARAGVHENRRQNPVLGLGE
jgi:hypothetical protein